GGRPGPPGRRPGADLPAAGAGLLRGRRGGVTAPGGAGKNFPKILKFLLDKFLAAGYNKSRPVREAEQVAGCRTARRGHTAGLCKGSTTDSDSVCEGSNPSPAAKKTPANRLVSFFYSPYSKSNRLLAITAIPPMRP